MSFFYTCTISTKTETLHIGDLYPQIMNDKIKKNVSISLGQPLSQEIPKNLLLSNYFLPCVPLILCIYSLPLSFLYHAIRP